MHLHTPVQFIQQSPRHPTKGRQSSCRKQREKSRHHTCRVCTRLTYSQVPKIRLKHVPINEGDGVLQPSQQLGEAVTCFAMALALGEVALSLERFAKALIVELREGSDGHGRTPPAQKLLELDFEPLQGSRGHAVVHAELAMAVAGSRGAGALPHGPVQEPAATAVLAVPPGEVKARFPRECRSEIRRRGAVHDRRGAAAARSRMQKLLATVQKRIRLRVIKLRVHAQGVLLVNCI
jgi:hypothetical protein